MQVESVNAAVPIQLRSAIEALQVTPGRRFHSDRFTGIEDIQASVANDQVVDADGLVLGRVGLAQREAGHHGAGIGFIVTHDGKIGVCGRINPQLGNIRVLVVTRDGMVDDTIGQVRRPSRVRGRTDRGDADGVVAGGGLLGLLIGVSSLGGPGGALAGALIGALMLTSLVNGCTLAGWPNYVQEIIIGVIIVIAVALDYFQRRAPA